MTRKLTLSGHLANLQIAGDPANVVIYGPYAPQKGRKTWRVVIEDDGNRKTLAVASEAEGNELKKLLLAEVQKRTQTTVYEALDSYLSYKSTKVGESWLSTLRDRLRRFLPDVPLSSITSVKAEALYIDETKRTGKFGTIKPASHHALLRNTREFFAWLVKRSLIGANPFANVEAIGRPNAGKRQPRHDEAKALDAVLFAEARKKDEGALALLVAMYGGFRSGEVMSFLVSDVDRQGRVVWVTRGKTRNSRRDVEIFEDVAELLHAHTVGRPPNERVFAAKLRQKPKPPWMHKRLARFCKMANIPQICPHALRGLNATLAIEGGAPTHAVAAALGHSSFEVTKRHYAEPAAVDKAKRRKVVASLRTAVGSSSEPNEMLQLVAELTPEQRLALKKLLLD